MRIDKGDLVEIGEGVHLDCAVCPICLERAWVVNHEIHRCCEHLTDIEFDEDGLNFIFEGIEKGAEN